MEKIKLFTILLSLSLLSSTTLYAQTESSRAAQYLYKIAKDYYEQGDYYQDLHEFKKVLLIEPRHKGALEYIKIIEAAKKQAEMILKEKAIAEAVREAEEILRAQELVTPEKISIEEITEIPSERRRAIIEALDAIKISGEYQIALGVTSDDIIWKDANGDRIGVPFEKNWRYLWGKERHNTFDPKIYNRLSLNIETDPEAKLRGFMEVVIDPWSFVGKTKSTVAGTGGDSVDFELKYWSNDGNIVNEIYRSDKGDIVNLNEIKVVDGKTTTATAVGLSDWGSNKFNIPITEIDRMYRPIRKFWIDYAKDDEYLLRIFPIADQSFSLTSDDPLVLSNNHVYWEESPWLDEWEPSRVFNAANDPLKKGMWIRRLSFFAKDSDYNRLTFLRGISFSGKFADTLLEATVATPMNLWDEYEHLNSIPAAARIKTAITDNLDLGGTYTFKMGLDGGSSQALSQVLGIDVNYRLSPTMTALAEVAGGDTDIDEANGRVSSYNGYAYKLNLLYEDEIFSADFALTHMDEDFYPSLSNYRYTRRDRFWSKHIRFSEMDPEDEAIRIGNSIDRGRNVVGLTAKAKLPNDNLELLINIRNVHEDSGKYIETVSRAEATYKLSPQLTSKFLAWYKHLPKTKGGYDPLIYAKTSYSLTDYFSEEDIFLENADVIDGQDPSIGTFSTGLRYDFNDTLALETIYECTNDPLDFPRGLLNDTYQTTETINGITYDKVVPFLYDQDFFDLPPYDYYDIFKVKFIYRPIDALSIALSHVHNENKYAAGIDDNINHEAVEIDYRPNDRLMLGFKYIYSRLKDVYKQNKDGGVHFDAHHNIFAELNYVFNENKKLTLQFGEFVSYIPMDSTYTPFEWSLSALDTQHLIRLFFSGKF